MFSVSKVAGDGYKEPVVHLDQNSSLSDIDAAVSKIVDDLQGFAYDAFSYHCREVSKLHPRDVPDFPPYEILTITREMLSKEFKYDFSRATLKRLYPCPDDRFFIQKILIVILGFFRFDGISPKDLLEIKVTRNFELIIEYRNSKADPKNPTIKRRTFPDRKIQESLALEGYYKTFKEEYCTECPRLRNETKCGATIAPGLVCKPKAVIIPEVEKVAQTKAPEKPVVTPTKATQEAKPEKKEHYRPKIIGEAANFDFSVFYTGKKFSHIEAASHVLMRVLTLNNGAFPSRKDFSEICRHWKVGAETRKRVGRIVTNHPQYDPRTYIISGLDFSFRESVKAFINKELTRLRYEAEEQKRKTLNQETTEQTKTEKPVIEKPVAHDTKVTTEKMTTEQDLDCLKNMSIGSMEELRKAVANVAEIHDLALSEIENCKKGISDSDVKWKEEMEKQTVELIAVKDKLAATEAENKSLKEEVVSLRKEKEDVENKWNKMKGVLQKAIKETKED